MARLTLNLVQGSVQFDFSEESAQQLQAEISKLMQSLKAISGASGRPSKQESMEYRYNGRCIFRNFL